MRRTKLTFDALVEALEDPERKDLEFLHLDEIGNILAEGGPEGQKAEEFLRDHWLNSKDPAHRLIAFRLLDALECWQVSTYHKIEKFKRNPVNAELVEEADRLNQEREKVEAI